MLRLEREFVQSNACRGPEFHFQNPHKKKHPSTVACALGIPLLRRWRQADPHGWPASLACMATSGLLRDSSHLSKNKEAVFLKDNTQACVLTSTFTVHTCICTQTCIHVNTHKMMCVHHAMNHTAPTGGRGPYPVGQNCISC